MTHRAVRTLMVLALAGSATASGCDCGGKVVNRQVRLTFVYPTDGSAVTSADDINTAAPGLQVNVVVRVVGAERGARVVLTNDLDIGPTGVPVPTDGTVTAGSDGAGQVVFAGYTLPDGQVTLTATLDNVTTSARITVVQGVCTFNSPRDGDVITADPHPPAQPDPLDPVDVDVVADCVGLSLGDFVAVRANDGYPVVGAVDDTGRVVMPATLPLAEGPNVLSLSAQTDAAGNNAQAATVTANVTVSTGRCTVSFIPGDGSRLLAQDDRDVAAGMQALLEVTTSCASTSTVEILIRQGAATSYTTLATFGAANYNAGTQRFEVGPLVLPESASPFDVQLVALVTDAAASHSGVSVPSHYWVDSIRPQLQLISPLGNLCVGPLQDVDTGATGIQTAAFGNVLLAESGSEVWVTVQSATQPLVTCAADGDCTTGTLCRALVCRTVGSVNASGNFTVQPIDVSAGEVTVEVSALDLAGNRTPEQSATLDVFDVAPTATVTSLTSGQRLGVSLDANPSVDGLQHELVVQLTNVPAGALGTVTLSGQAPQTFLPAGGAAVEEHVPLTLLDGAHTVVVRVEDSCGNRTESAAIDVLVDTSPSALLITAYEGGGYGARQVVDDGGSTWAATLDVDVVVGTASTDRSVEVRVTDAFAIDATGRTCTGTQTHLTSSPVLAAELGAVFADVPLASGAGSSTINCVTVTVDDGINQTSTTRLFYRRLATPTPTIADPANAATLSVDADAAPGFNAPMTVTLNAADTAAGTLLVDIGAWNVVRKVVPAGTDTIIFAASELSLPLGTFDLTARYRDAFGNEQTSGVISITVDDLGGAPELVLTQPQGGEATSSSTFTVTHTAGPTPVTCSLYVDGAGAPVATEAFIAGPLGSLNLTAPSLASGAHSTWVTCVDGVAVTGSTQAVSFVYYGAAPAAPLFLNEPTTAPGRLVFDVPGGYVNMYVPDTASASSLQHDVTAQLAAFDGLEGWQLEVTVTPPGGSATPYTRTIPVGGSGTVVFSSIDFGSSDGALRLSLVAIDPLGVSSTATVVDFTVDRTPPVLTQTEPEPSVVLLTSANDADLDPTYVDVYFAHTVVGGVFDQDCSLTPDLCISLDITPIPATHAAADFPQRLVVASAPPVPRFGPYGLADGSYSVDASVHDAAGNAATLTYNVDVVNLKPQIDFAPGTVPAMLTRTQDTNKTTPSFEGQFVFNGRGLATGSTVVLCSTVPTPGDPSPVACKLGADGTASGPNRGYVVGTAYLSGTLNASAASMSAVLLEQGPQTLHAEAAENVSAVPVVSDFLAVVVDSQPPIVTAFSLPQNVTTNDATGGILRLNGAGVEGTVQGSTLVTGVALHVTGANGRSVQVKSGAVVVGSGTIDGSGDATFNITLAQGSHTLTVYCTDDVGNPNEPVTNNEPTISALVDVAPGTVSVAAAAFALYDAAHGTLNEHGTPGVRGDDTLDVTINVGVSDNLAVTGGTVTLARYSAASGGTAAFTVNQTLSAGQSTVTFVDFPLVQAISANYLAATFSDAAANVASSELATNDNGRRAYAVDFYGPTLTLEARNGVGGTLSCSSATPCMTDILDPGIGRAYLDVSGIDGYRAAGGTGLYYTLLECANGFAEDCALTNISVALQSRIAGSGTSYSLVDGGAYGAAADVASAALYRDDVGSSPHTVLYGLDPGAVREMRLVATDKNGNVTVSSSVFLQLDVNGVLVEVERLDAGGNPLATPEFLADDTYWNNSENQGAPPAFTTAMRVHVTRIGLTTPVPTDITLQVTALTRNDMHSATLIDDTGGFYHADFTTAAAIAFTASADLQHFDPNSVDVTVDCVATPGCGARTYLNIVPDLDGPTYEFWRCSLRDLQVPLVGDDAAIYAACDGAAGDAQANILATDYARWNAAGDRDANAANGFTIIPTAAPVREPLVVKIQGLEDNQPVDLLSSQTGGLSGQTEALSANCGGGTPDCEATFSNVGVTSLSGTAQHDISVLFYDRAGNPAQPDPVRTGEVIHARVDVIAPAGTLPTSCIGESTTPQGVTPATDPTTYEDPAICPSACTASGLCS
ncbi:MAG: hypothetical protein AAB426_08840, partial [Myxococcota bacterium]